MPFYDFRCDECDKLVEDEFFKIADEKDVKCEECGVRMKQVILSAPGLSDPGGTGQKWTNDGYQMVDEKSGNPRIIKETWEKGKNVIRDDVHKDDPNPTTNKKVMHDRFVKDTQKILNSKQHKINTALIHERQKDKKRHK